MTTRAATMTLCMCVLLCVAGACNTQDEASSRVCVIPTGAETLYKLAWYVDDMNHSKFVSDSTHRIKDRLAAVGIKTNGIWDVAYLADRNVLIVRGTVIPVKAIQARLRSLEKTVPSEMIKEYIEYEVGIWVNPETSLKLSYDSATGTLGVLRRTRDPEK